MKLYSRNQVLFFTVTGSLLAALFTVGVMLTAGRAATGKAAHSGGNAEATIRPVLDEPDLQTNPAQGTRGVANGETYSRDEQENISVYGQYNEGVVNISTEIMRYNWFLEPMPSEGGSGSGSIIDKRGYVLTNYHVVKNAYKVQITLADGEQYDGEVSATDEENDLAMVKFDPKGKVLVTIPFGRSGDLKVGQKVLAIGNPFAFQRTLTVGIVSGLGRPIQNEAGHIIRDMIQTDASINPGNSGGPLLNTRGEMVGINTMIYSPSGGSVGIGFAVPVDTARRVVPELIKYGTVRRGWIEFDGVQLFPDLVEYANLTVAKGVLVSQTASGGNAAKAGIRGGDRARAVRTGRKIIYLGGDIIVEVAGAKIEGLADVHSALEDKKPGQVVDVVIVRGNERKTVKVTLAERPKQGGNRLPGS